MQSAASGQQFYQQQQQLLQRRDYARSSKGISLVEGLHHVVKHFNKVKGEEVSGKRWGSFTFREGLVHGLWTKAVGKDLACMQWGMDGPSIVD